MRQAAVEIDLLGPEFVDLGGDVIGQRCERNSRHLTPLVSSWGGRAAVAAGDGPSGDIAALADPFRQLRSRHLGGLPPGDEPDVTRRQTQLGRRRRADEVRQRLGGPRRDDLVAPAEDVEVRAGDVGEADLAVAVGHDPGSERVVADERLDDLAKRGAGERQLVTGPPVHRDEAAKPRVVPGVLEDGELLADRLGGSQRPEAEIQDVGGHQSRLVDDVLGVEPPLQKHAAHEAHPGVVTRGGKRDQIADRRLGVAAASSSASTPPRQYPTSVTSSAPDRAQAAASAPGM